MKRDLAASVGVDDWDVFGVDEQVFRFARYALREDGIVLYKPEFIGRFGRSRIGEGAHLQHRLLIVNATERSTDNVGDHERLKRPNDVGVRGEVLIERVELRFGVRREAH